jgi:hypothetical protein
MILIRFHDQAVFSTALGLIIILLRTDHRRVTAAKFVCTYFHSGTSKSLGKEGKIANFQCFCVILYSTVEPR